jgi:hypothetical protein
MNTTSVPLEWIAQTQCVAAMGITPRPPFEPSMSPTAHNDEMLEPARACSDFP